MNNNINKNDNPGNSVSPQQGKETIQSQKIGIIAHRGAHKNGPGSPNSMTAFQDAIAKGFFAFECDVLFSLDSQVVVAHGPNTGYDGGFPDVPIHSSNWKELSQVALASGDFIPRLSQVLELVKEQKHTRLIIELKETQDGRNQELARAVYRLVHNHEAHPWVSYISFDYQQLLEILKLNPNAHCSPLDHCRPALSYYVNDGMWGVAFNYQKYSPALIQACQAERLVTNAWTVNDCPTLKTLIDWGVDLVTTDEPEQLSDYLASLSQ